MAKKKEEKVIYMERDPRDDNLIERFWGKKKLEKMQKDYDYKMSQYELGDKLVKDREDYYKLSGWKKLSTELRKKNLVCELCGENLATEVHHIIKWYDQFNEENKISLLLDPENCMCVCSYCHHSKIHGHKLNPVEKEHMINKKTEICNKYLRDGIVIRYTND